MLTTTSKGARTSGVTFMIVVVPATEPHGTATSPNHPNMEAAKWFRKDHSAGAAAEAADAFSTGFTRAAIAMVAATKPRAIRAVVPRTRAKPPRL